jgi:hypothetical protein
VGGRPADGDEPEYGRAAGEEARVGEAGEEGNGEEGENRERLGAEEEGGRLDGDFDVVELVLYR